MTKFVGNNITLPKLSAAPSSPVSGDTYYDTTFNKPFTYNGTEWVDLTLTSATTGATGYWGSFWSTQDQTAASANTAYAITLNNTDAASSGVSIVSNSRLTFAYSGVYSIIFSVQWINTDNSDQDGDIWLRKNGSNIADSNSQWTVPSRHGSIDGYAIGSVNFVLSLTAGDYIELYWQVTNTTVSIQYEAAASPAPAVPSVILTATQVMNTQQVELTNSTSTTSSTIAASATAVKSAYDLAGGKAAVGSTAPSATNTTSSVGSSAEASRADHVHATVTSSATPLSVATTAAVGTSGIPSRQDHVHAGVTSIAGTENQVTASASAGEVTISLPQSISTGSNVTFNRVTASDYIALSSWNQAGAGLVGTASSVTVTTAGTYYAIGGSACEVSFTPDFVGQKFFVTMTGYAALNTTTVQYAFVRTTLTDSSNVSQADLSFSRSENFGTSGRGGTVATSLVWTSDTTSARKIKLYGTSQTTNGLVLTLAYWQLNVMALA